MLCHVRQGPHQSITVRETEQHAGRNQTQIPVSLFNTRTSYPAPVYITTRQCDRQVLAWHHEGLINQD